jgi:hypothetical protein
MSSPSSNPNPNPQGQPHQQPGLWAGHAEYIKGAAEVRLCNRRYHNL